MRDARRIDDAKKGIVEMPGVLPEASTRGPTASPARDRREVGASSPGGGASGRGAKRTDCGKTKNQSLNQRGGRMDGQLTLESRLEGANARIDSYEKGTTSS